MGETMQSAVTKRNIIALAVALVLSGASARAITTTFAASQDVTLFGGGDATANNTSSGPGMFVGSDGGSPKRGLIEFNIGSIPAGSTITSASLTLTLGMVAGSAGSDDPTLGDGKNTRTIQLFAATSDWSGTTLGATGTTNTLSNPFGGTGHGFSPPHANDSTWNWEHFNTQHWNTPTGGGDFVSTPSASLTFAANQSIRFNPYTWTSTLMTADVQGWLDGTVANDGWLLKNTEEAVQSFRAFFTKEGAIEENAPQFQPILTVSFTSPDVVPEPAGLAILLISAPMMLRRRRQVMA